MRNSEIFLADNLIFLEIGLLGKFKLKSSLKSWLLHKLKRKLFITLNESFLLLRKSIFPLA